MQDGESTESFMKVVGFQLLSNGVITKVRFFSFFPEIHRENFNKDQIIFRLDKQYGRSNLPWIFS